MKKQPIARSKELGTDSPQAGFTLSKLDWSCGGTASPEGSPGAGKPHTGQYREWTLLRQRGGSGLLRHSLTHWLVMLGLLRFHPRWRAPAHDDFC